MALEGVFANLQEMGVIDVILPFILIFTIVFAIMQKVKIFGTDPKTKNFNVVIALVMGLAVVFPHVLGYYPPEQDIVNIINTSLPNVSVVLVAILMALLIVGILGKRFELAGNSLSGWIAIGAFAVVVWIFGASANWWSLPSFLDFVLQNPDLTALVLVILVFAIVIWFITKEPATEESRKRGIGYQLGQMLQSSDKKE
jgi:hypothetical protein